MTGRFERAATQLVERLNSRQIKARVAGSVGILILMKSDGFSRPQSPNDIDLALRAKQQAALQSFLTADGWYVLKELLLVAEMRETYLRDDRTLTLDVFYEEIDGNHPIAISNRLDCSFPTLAWTDLLLTKLQRRQMRKEDIWDVALLLSSVENVDVGRFQACLGSSWGLYTTVTDNLRNIEKTTTVRAREASYLLELADQAPRSLAWKLRSLIGRRLKWWQEVSTAHVS